MLTKTKYRENMDEICVFCESNQKKKRLFENSLAFVFEDDFPVTNGHSLIIPKRHYPNFFDSTQKEIVAIYQLLVRQKEFLLEQDQTIVGFNVGINIGYAAGQSIFHLHVHLIPRRVGDIDDPKGGVRGIIPLKKNY